MPGVVRDSVGVVAGRHCSVCFWFEAALGVGSIVGVWFESTSQLQHAFPDVACALWMKGKVRPRLHTLWLELGALYVKA